jgi:hypothetical protein
MIYSIYTFVYRLLTLLFTYFIWKDKSFGWIGTVAVSLLVIIVDTLAVFDLVNNYENIDEWNNANLSMSILDEGVPYGVLSGNHDGLEDAQI